MTVAIYAAVAIEAAASVTGTASYITHGGVTISAQSLLEATANYITHGDVTIIAAGELSLIPVRVRAGSVDIIAVAALSLDAVRQRLGEVTIEAAASVAADAVVYLIEQLVYSGDLGAGDVLEIDTDKMTVKLNGSDVRYDITGTFFKLLSGGNEVEYTDSEASRTVGVKVEHSPRDM
ncbi:MAG: hypothetical protein JRD89_06010 [Deltaproteobacteria bacterium]|nr:hypothetical protein [Deltaproteobacteria bacterium]